MPGVSEVKGHQMVVSLGTEEAELINDLEDITLLFGCKYCQASFPSLQAMLLHIRSGECKHQESASPTQAGGDAGEPQPGTSQSDPPPVKRRPGRPRKTPLPTAQTQTPSPGPQKPVDGSNPPKKRGRPRKEYTAVVCEEEEIIVPRRATRVSTGAIQRRNILEILDDVSTKKDEGIFIPEKTEPFGDSPRPRGRPPKPRDEQGQIAKRPLGRPRKIRPDEETANELGEEEPDREDIKRRRIDEKEGVTPETPEQVVYVQVEKRSDGLEDLQGYQVQKVTVGEDGEMIAYISKDEESGDQVKQEHADLQPGESISSELGKALNVVASGDMGEGHIEKETEDLPEKEDINSVTATDKEEVTDEEAEEEDEEVVIEFDSASGQSKVIHVKRFKMGKSVKNPNTQSGTTEIMLDKDEKIKEVETKENSSEDVKLSAAGTDNEMDNTVTLHIPSEDKSFTNLDYLNLQNALLEVEGFEVKERIKQEQNDPDFLVKGSTTKSGRIQMRKQYYANISQAKREFKCKICRQRFFWTEEELDLHHKAHVNKQGGKNHREEEKYKCISCDYISVSWNRILEHIVSHEENKQKYMYCEFLKNIMGEYQCPICKKKFDRKNNMKGHVKKVHYKQDKDCPICHKTLEGVDDKTFKRHVEKCEGKVFACEHCSYRTNVSLNYRKHIKIHKGEGHECEVCHSLFPTKQRYKSHMLIHDPNRVKCMCEHCGQEFLTEDAVKKHVVRIHAVVTEIYQCPECEFTAKLETDLKKHYTIVHQKKYKCSECEYRTNSEHAINAHMEYHNPERRFPCSYDACYYRGLTQKQLMNHISQVHKTCSKHQCPICLKFYKKKTHLARHLVSHTGDKPYVCLECGEEFTSHSTYYRHRNKFGHDAKREGIVSVPQNITIQYVTPEDEFHLEAGQASPPDGLEEGEASEDAEHVEAEMQEVNGKNIIMLTQEEGPEGQEVTYVLQVGEDGSTTAVPATEEMLQQLQQMRSKGIQPQQQVMQMQANHQMEVSETLYEVQQEAGADGEVVMEIDQQGTPQQHIQVHDGHEIPLQQVMEMGEVVEQVGIQSEEELGQEIHYSEQVVQEEVAEVQHIIQEEVKEEQIQQMVYHQDGNIHAMVEVAPPGGQTGGNNQQYAIVVLPQGQSAAEPEAALSMLQLGSSMQ